MQDIRLRAGCTAFLSLAAFSGTTGALIVFIWWLVFAHPRKVLQKFRIVIPAIVLIAFFSLILELTGGGGAAYGLRMTVIVLIGAWAYMAYRQGEFLGLSTWMLGNRTGFELGMIAEMGMQSLDLMAADFTRIRQACELKGRPRGFRNLLPAADILIRGAIRRADETAELMAVRGYRDGGSGCPVFRTPGSDLVAALAAVCMGIIAFLPVSEFFILYH
jgi:energy-coupling factor transport system permease protein